MHNPRLQVPGPRVRYQDPTHPTRTDFGTHVRRHLVSLGVSVCVRLVRCLGFNNNKIRFAACRGAAAASTAAASPRAPDAALCHRHRSG